MLSSSAKLAISIGKINFVKKLGKYSFKRGKNSLHSKPHAIPLKEVEKAEKGGFIDKLKAKELAANSQTPYGNFTKGGKFIVDYSKIPVYDIPDLKGFKLKPYVHGGNPSPRKEAVKQYIDESIFAAIEANLQKNNIDTKELREFFDKKKNKHGVYKPNE